MANGDGKIEVEVGMTLDTTLTYKSGKSRVRSGEKNGRSFWGYGLVSPNGMNFATVWAENPNDVKGFHSKLLKIAKITSVEQNPKPIKNYQTGETENLTSGRPAFDHETTIRAYIEEADNELAERDGVYDDELPNFV